MKGGQVSILFREEEKRTEESGGKNGKAYKKVRRKGERGHIL